ncbi:uncharacterized protein LOC115287313 isoform X2 [Suricata suricatta]|uniref:uncharacterized protein LOC115287313 isoform X2 n=1 Tax=Suricata suricatta TaxID=37032 RepID=UPI0011556A20|nr:uncharacterized protein LOC115287313 isoform X2 [Suricata suricatta]
MRTLKKMMVSDIFANKKSQSCYFHLFISQGGNIKHMMRVGASGQSKESGLVHERPVPQPKPHEAPTRVPVGSLSSTCRGSLGPTQALRTLAAENEPKVTFGSAGECGLWEVNTCTYSAADVTCTQVLGTHRAWGLSRTPGTAWPSSRHKFVFMNLDDHHFSLVSNSSGMFKVVSLRHCTTLGKRFPSSRKRRAIAQHSGDAPTDLLG